MKGDTYKRDAHIIYRWRVLLQVYTKIDEHFMMC